MHVGAESKVAAEKSTSLPERLNFTHRAAPLAPLKGTGHGDASLGSCTRVNKAPPLTEEEFFLMENQGCCLHDNIENFTEDKIMRIEISIRI